MNVSTPRYTCDLTTLTTQPRSGGCTTHFGCLGLTTSLLELHSVSQLTSPQLEVQGRPHLLQLHSGQPTAGFLQQDSKMEEKSDYIANSKSDSVRYVGYKAKVGKNANRQLPSFSLFNLNS